eukprot:CAMPEP_0202904778 /NCGR_PEP_ID=MMETSP1392-20130828/31047_1 /ASSEMBLY_ACC=CAM_ASM_000868 /TAXON_ID=225041 /ORGANISM="Chlamydomonas chlamydogama, Strain SAG 11-48b" /LENGTH=49 /DNA_ID=CAMNT_0049592581 /DNA_START=17 /DNA_END=166 /DNA_ORIENTATION=-
MTANEIEAMVGKSSQLVYLDAVVEPSEPLPVELSVRLSSLHKDRCFTGQ